jgi:hypothetical protein
VSSGGTANDFVTLKFPGGSAPTAPSQRADRAVAAAGRAVEPAGRHRHGDAGRAAVDRQRGRRARLSDRALPGEQHLHVVRRARGRAGPRGDPRGFERRPEHELPLPRPRPQRRRDLGSVQCGEREDCEEIDRSRFLVRVRVQGSVRPRIGTVNTNLDPGTWNLELALPSVTSLLRQRCDGRCQTDPAHACRPRRATPP